MKYYVITLFFLLQSSLCLAVDVGSLDISGVKLGDSVDKAQKIIEQAYPGAQKRVASKPINLDGQQRDALISYMFLYKQEQGKETTTMIGINPDLEQTDKVNGVFELTRYVREDQYPLTEEVIDMLIQKHGQPSCRYYKKGEAMLLWLDDKNKLARDGGSPFDDKRITGYTNFILVVQDGSIYDPSTSPYSETGLPTKENVREIVGIDRYLLCGVRFHRQSDGTISRQHSSDLICGLIDEGGVRRSYEYSNKAQQK